MSDPGRLNQRLVLETATETPDGAGGSVRSFAVTATVWAAVTPIAARDVILAAAAGVTVTHQIIARTGLDITTRDRFTQGARVFRIVTVREQDSVGRFLVIEAEERRD